MLCAALSVFSSVRSTAGLTTLQLCVRIEDNDEGSVNHRDLNGSPGKDSEDKEKDSLPATKISIHVCRCTRNESMWRADESHVGRRAAAIGKQTSDKQEQSRFEVTHYFLL